MFEKYAKLSFRIPDPHPKHIPYAQMEYAQPYAHIGENIIPHALWPLLRRAAADLEGFAHSAAAGPNTAHEMQSCQLTHLKYRLEAFLVDFALNYRLSVVI